MGRSLLRRRSLLIVGVALLAALLAGSVTPAPPAVGALEVAGPGVAAPSAAVLHWSTFHGGENHSGYTPQNGPRIGTISWDFATPNGQPIRTGVVADAYSIYFADDLGTVWAYNRSASPGFLWNYSLGTTPTTADLWNGELLIGGSNGNLNAISAANGTLLWTQALDGAIPQGVAVDGGTVFAGTTSGSVWALNATSGLPLWHTPIGAAIAGAVAVEGGTIVVDTSLGGVVALAENGSIRWSASTGRTITSGPAVFGSAVVVADTSANVSRFSLSNGSMLWRFVGRTVAVGDVIESTPAVDGARVYTTTDLGQVLALSLSNGSLEWNRSTGYTGYAVLASPAIAPNGLYVSDAFQYVDDLDPATGRLQWSQSLLFSPAYGPPAIDNGLVIEGQDIGTVYAFGPVGGPLSYNVTGSVTDLAGTPIAGASVTVEGVSHVTATNGTFALALPNGSYPVVVSANGYLPDLSTIVVAGPVAGLRFALAPVPVVLVTGTVVDGQTLRPLVGVPVFFSGPYGSQANTTSGANGSFALLAPVGLDYVTASPPRGFGPYAAHVVVPSTGLSGLVLSLPVAGGGLDARGALVPLAATVVALLAVGIWAQQRRRRELGMPTGLLSPFATYVAMRLILLLFQAVGILSVLYVFGTMLPAVAFHVGPCAFIDQGCGPGGWSNPSNLLLAFVDGIYHFVARLATGDWGTTTFGHLREPAFTFLQWYGPSSIELALFALPISAGLAYVIGLWAGAHPDSGFDVAARVGSIAGLLVPSFLIVLLFLGAVYVPFLHTFGDTPYGFLPTSYWFVLHGGYPAWIGTGSNTSPTGFPLVDGTIHGDWPFVRIVFLKTIWQALAVAVVYVSIYLRFVRYAVSEAFREPNIVAARARGISESTILWRHTGRRILPLLVLVFGLTLPLYIGTQALVEALAQDNGIGTLLVSQMTNTLQSGFGFRAVAPGQSPQSFYQVTLFLLVFLVLFGELVADVVARWLDPRLLKAPR